MARTSTSVAKQAPKANLPADVQAQFAQELAEYSKRIQAPTGDRITVTNRKTFKLPNGQEVPEIEAIVVDFVAANYYYPTAYDSNSIVPPDCFSIGLEPSSLIPSDNSPDKQCNACAGCWANQFKSAGKGKACSNTRLLALLTTDADVESPIYTLKVSPTALKSFDGHVGQVMRSFNAPIRAVVTRIGFSPDSEYATLRFSTVGPVDKDLLILAQSRLAEARERLQTEPDVSAVAAANESGKKPAPKRAARR
jgi:hypothetical protein